MADLKRPGSPDDFATTRTRRDEDHRPTLGFVVVAVAGPDQGRAWPCTPSVATSIGTSEVCAVRLSDREVSRRHARVEGSRGEWRLRDLGSTNGTWIDGVRVVEVFLAPGMRIRMGATVLEAHAAPAGVDAASATSDDARASFGRLVGESREMRMLYPMLDRIAAARVPVLIEGEPGTGKELLAECLHEAGATKDGPFVVFAAADVGADRADDELFRALAAAAGGTLLVDEITSLAPALQSKLTRALERTPGAARVVATSRRDVERDVQEGRFDERLLHVIGGARVELPPLRRRTGDVDVLAHHFARELGAPAAPDDALDVWRDAAWPGNIRELRHAVVRRIVLDEPVTRGTPGDGSRVDDLDRFVADAVGRSVAFSRAREELLRAFERSFVEHALARHGGNVVRAASASGLARRYFQLLKARRDKPGG